MNIKFLIRSVLSIIAAFILSACAHHPQSESTTASHISSDEKPGPRAEFIASNPDPKPTEKLVDVTLEADALFGFDSSTLSKQGKQALDKIVVLFQKTLARANIRVIGHADHLGPRNYNITLAANRAGSVASYLIEKGISENLISTVSKGASEPVVECPNLSGSRLIQCLAPNRRANVIIHAVEVRAQSHEI